MANGKVVTGFSKPIVAVYTNNEGTVSYGATSPLARGVSVSIEPDEASTNDFYADNTLAERISTPVRGGTVTLTVDGLKAEAEKLILGLPEADEQGHYHYGKSMTSPFVGIGFIIQTLSEGVTKYVGMQICKAQFKIPSISANTSTESIDFQTSELTATFMASDNSNMDWRILGKECATEAEAMTDLLSLFTA